MIVLVFKKGEHSWHVVLDAATYYKALKYRSYPIELPFPNDDDDDEEKEYTWPSLIIGRYVFRNTSEAARLIGRLDEKLGIGDSVPLWIEEWLDSWRHQDEDSDDEFDASWRPGKYSEDEAKTKPGVGVGA